ncbi:MAG: TVP38/TMEM64 family protein [Leptolyngbyaceae cyanobacterium bins.302]|nr:TVP38/TMEM64 family protein [Leptolyngbyaceae cyanobacterium bins.302]
MYVKQRYKVVVWLGLFVAAMVGVCLHTPVKLLFNEAFLAMEFRQLGDGAPLLFVLLFTMALTIGLPGNVLAVVGGTVFGLTWGTVWSLLGSTCGAVLAFLLARHFLHRWIENRFGQHPSLQKLNRAIAQHPFAIVLATRFTPLSPFSLVNFLFGLTVIDLGTYTIGTFLGLIPLTFAYSWLGQSGYAAFQGGDRVSLYLAMGLLTVLSVLPMLMRRPAK